MIIKLPFCRIKILEVPFEDFEDSKKKFACFLSVYVWQLLTEDVTLRLHQQIWYGTNK